MKVTGRCLGLIPVLGLSVHGISVLVGLILRTLGRLLNNCC